MSEAAIAELKVYVREREYQQVPVVSVQLHPQHEPQQLYSMNAQTASQIWDTDGSVLQMKHFWGGQYRCDITCTSNIHEIPRFPTA